MGIWENNALALANQSARYIGYKRKSYITDNDCIQLITINPCLQVRDSVPLSLYSNGILMFGGPFRPYSDPVTQVSGWLLYNYLTCVYWI